MSFYLGDFNAGDTVRFMWNSNDSNGASITRSTNGTVSVYQNGDVTQSTTGVTDTEDFDGLTGVHLVAVDTSADGTFYAAGRDFAIVLSAATIDTRTVNAVLAHFSIAARSALRPTVATRTVDVTATGAVGIDWGNVENPTTALNLSGTNIDPDQVVASVTAPVTAGTVSDKTGYALSGAGVTAVQSGLSTLSAAQINAEMLDVLTVDTFAEPSGAPAATSTLKDKIGWLFKLSRNLRKTTSTTDSVYNDAGAVVDSTSTISDDGTTFTRSEYT